MEAAITSWFNTVYMPVIAVIEKYKIMKYIKKRTAGDLYIWLIHYYDELKKKFGDGIPLDIVANDIKQEYKWSLLKKMKNLKNKLLFRRKKSNDTGKNNR